MLPFSFLADILGKKIIGNIGLISSLFGFVLLIFASVLPDISHIWIIGIGIVLFGIGTAMTLGNWFALLHPIIPEKIRGRIFWTPAADMAVYRDRFNFIIHIHPQAIPIPRNVPGYSDDHLNFYGSPHTVLPANT